MRLRTLGKLELSGSRIQRTKPLALLAYLALDGVKSREHLAILFYGGTRDARNGLSRALSYLRRDAAGSVQADRSRVWTTVASDVVDLLASAEAGRFGEVVAHYGGSFLHGEDAWAREELEEWIFTTREVVDAYVRRAHLHLAEGAARDLQFEVAARHAEAAYQLGGRTNLEPEEFERIYSLLHLSQSPRAVEIAREAGEYGISLDRSTLEEYERGSSPPAPKSVSTNLPSPTSSFVGRDPELLEIASLMTGTECRLLTLRGPGGVGKSRLALQAAHDLARAGAFADGLFFVPLESLTSPEQVAARIAETMELGLRSETPLLELAAWLRDRTVLLVLDNYEELLDFDFLPSELLRNCPDLRIIVTSREPLNLEEEWLLNLDGLAVPDSDLTLTEAHYNESILLFVRRAKKADLAFTITEENLGHVVTICRIVEGVPLGIELAAAMIRTTPLHDVARQVSENMGSLISTKLNTSERHRSTHAVFLHSWELLTREQRRVLRRLSIFQGGFRREAGNVVAGATLATLSQLVEKSLLRIVRDGRYDFHALIHHFAAERLSADRDEHDETRSAHARYFLVVAREMQEQFARDPAGWTKRIDEEEDNYRRVLAWYDLGDDTAALLQLVTALQIYWEQRGRFIEGLEWSERALSRKDAARHPRHLGHCLLGAGLLAYGSTDFPRARNYYERSLRQFERLGDLAGQGTAHLRTAMLDHHQGEFDRASLGYQRARELFEETGDTRRAAHTTFNLALLFHNRGNFETAREMLLESLELFRSLDEEVSIASCLQALGNILKTAGEYEAAREKIAEALAIYRKIGSPLGVANALVNLGNVAHFQRDFPRAENDFSEALKIYREIGHLRGISFCMNNLGNLAYDCADYPLARGYYHQSLEIDRKIGDKEGSSISLHNIGNTFAYSGQPEQAAAAYRESLELAIEGEFQTVILNTADGLAHIASARGDPLTAARIYGATTKLRNEIGDVYSEVDQAQLEEKWLEAREQLEDGKFEQALALGGTWDWKELLDFLHSLQPVSGNG